MKNYPAFVRSLIYVALMSLLCSCAAATTPQDQGASEPPPLMSGPEVAPIEFKSGVPSGAETVEQSVLDEFDLRSLERDFVVIKTYKTLRFEVLGFTDDVECEGSECTALSLRRATLIRNWLLSRGVSADQLEEPVGHGSTMPIDDNGSEAGRSRNRRVEVNISP